MSREKYISTILVKMVTDGRLLVRAAFLKSQGVLKICEST